MKTNLKKHNVEPVKKVLDAFNAGEQRVALAHATGTGKSYATCAIIELGNFKNVLYLSPSNHINKYFERVVIKNLGNRQAINILATYSFLLHRDLSALAGKYDLIVLDEYHRLGAKEWGKAVKVLLELNPQAKILGLTATEVRYRDNWRNMSKELNFNVVSTITLVDAIERRILPAPEYIIGFSDFNIIIKELEALAIKCKADKEYLEEIKKMKVDWVNSNGLAGIVRYHLPITTSKIVVFSEAIKQYDDIVKKMTEVLTASGFKNLKFLRADSDTKESMDNIEYFSTNNDKNEVKIIISVNMLNEGIHAEGAEACFMFRKTTSANIFLQQLGRVESSLDSEKKPIVFDLVNNISNDWELFTQIGLGQVGESTKVGHNCIKRILGIAGVKVYSYVEAALEVKRKLCKLYGRHLNYTIQDLIDFVNMYNRLPNNGIKSETALYSWMRNQINNGNQDVIDIYNRYITRIHFTIQDLIDFVNKYNRLPRNINSESSLYNWMLKQLKSGNQEVIEIYEKHKLLPRFTTQNLIDFVSINNCLPKVRGTLDKESELCKWMYYQINTGNKEVIEIYEKYKVKYCTVQDFITFVNTYKKLPKSKSKDKFERALNGLMRRQLKLGNKEVIEIYEKYKVRRITLQNFKDFIDIYGYLPGSYKCSKYESRLHTWMYHQLHKGNQEVIDIYNRFNPDKPWKG